GEGEIRTPERLAPLPVFKTGAFNRSATSPYQLTQRLAAFYQATGELRLPTRARASSARALPAAARASTSSGQQTGSPGKPGAGEAGGVLANQIPGGETMPQRWET